MTERMVFGQTTPSEAQEVANKLRAPYQPGNPCIEVYGEGPLGKLCGTCTLFNRTQRVTTWGTVTTVSRCRLRPTSGAGEHYTHWQSCARYEKREEDK